MPQFELNFTVSYHYNHESVIAVTHVSSRNSPFVEKNIKKQYNFAREFNNLVSQFIDSTTSKRNEWLNT